MPRPMLVRPRCTAPTHTEACLCSDSLMKVTQLLFTTKQHIGSPIASLAVARNAPRVPCLAQHTQATTASASEQLQYGGVCTTCGQQHYLRATPAALEAAALLVQQLDSSHRIDFDAAVPDPRFGSAHVWTKGPGRMFGVMVCSDNQGQQHVLKAFSGQMTEEWHVPGWVGPVAGITGASEQYIRYRQLTEQLSHRINQIQAAITQHQASKAAPDDAGARSTASPAASSRPSTLQHPAQMRRLRQVKKRGSTQRPLMTPALEALQQQQARLTAVRKALSHELLLMIQGSYSTQDLRGRPLQLRNVYEQQCMCTGVQPNRLQYAGALSLKLAETMQEGGGVWALQQQQLLLGEDGIRQQALGPPQRQEALQGSQQPVAPAVKQVVCFPAGTGDCCAPKLIHAALQAGLQPLGMVEFWYGAPPGTATKPKAGRQLEELLASASRVHKQCYPMCAKCRTILGTMLCRA